MQAVPAKVGFLDSQVFTVLLLLALSAVRVGMVGLVTVWPGEVSVLAVGKALAVSVTLATSGSMAYEDVAVQPEMTFWVTSSIAVILAWHLNAVDFLLVATGSTVTCSRQGKQRGTKGGQHIATAEHAHICS